MQKSALLYKSLHHCVRSPVQSCAGDYVISFFKIVGYFFRGETNIEFWTLNKWTHVLTNELERIFSPDFQVWGMLSRTEDAWHANYVCTLQLTNTSNSRKNKFSVGRHGQFLPPAPFSNGYCDMRWSSCIMLKYESSLILLSYFRTNIRTFIRLLHP